MPILLPVVVKQPQRCKKKWNHKVERENVIILIIPYRGKKKKKRGSDKIGLGIFNYTHY